MADAVKAKSGKGSEVSNLMKMADSCSKVTKSILAGSDGDKDKVNEYMKNVCSQDNAGSKEAERCSKFGDALEAFMSDDTESNRDDLDTKKFCEGFFHNTVEVEAVQEVKRMEEEAKKKAAADAEAKKKLAEEAAKKAFEAKVAAAKTAQENAREEELKSMTA